MILYERSSDAQSFGTCPKGQYAQAEMLWPEALGARFATSIIHVSLASLDLETQAEIHRRPITFQFEHATCINRQSVTS